MSEESIAACKLVLETKVVVRALPFHCTAEVGAKLLPVTVSMKLALPVTAELGLNSVIFGGGTLIAKFTAFDVPPPGAGFVTVTVAVLTVAMSAADMAACKLVFETNVVARALPFHCTVEEAMKFVPVTVNTKPASPAKAALGPSDTPVGVGLLIVKVSAPEVPPPGAGVKTVTIAVPLAVTSAAVIAACKLVLETNVVVRAVPFHCTIEEDMKLAPVTVSVNAAPPTTAELGLREPFASDGLGLGGGGGGGV
jgi:hypothetical protein